MEKEYIHEEMLELEDLELDEEDLLILCRQDIRLSFKIRRLHMQFNCICNFF